MRKKENRYDFQAIGQAVKEARTKQGITREHLAERLGIAVRYLAEIENKGQHPSFQIFYELITMFHISVDEFFYPSSKSSASTKRRQVDSLLDSLDDKELSVLEATAKAIVQTKMT